MPILLLVACTNKPAEKQKEKYAEPFPVVKDTMGIDLYSPTKYAGSNERLTTSKFILYHVGPRKDTIYLNIISEFMVGPKYLGKDNHPYKKYFISDYDTIANQFSEEREFEIRVDTTQKIYDSYPVLITNKGKDTAIIGMNLFLSIKLEALDSTGKWLPIQVKPTWGCGTVITHIILPPKECALTLVSELQGEFKTKFRMNYENFYSQTFTGSIPYWLFDYTARENQQRYNH